VQVAGDIWGVRKRSPRSDEGEERQREPQLGNRENVPRPIHRGGQVQVDAAACVAARERGIPCLRIHAHGRGTHAETLRDECIGVKRRVGLFDRLDEGELVQRQTGHAQPTHGVRHRCDGVEGQLVYAVSTHGDEQRASVLGSCVVVVVYALCCGGVLGR
jgi:hypothetical protein